MKQYDKIRKGKVTKKPRRKKVQDSKKHKLKQFMKDISGYYYDKEEPKYKSKRLDFDYILNIVCVFIIIAVALAAEYLLCAIFYQIGYDNKIEEENDSMYQKAHNQVYYEGYMEGLSMAGTEGIERKTELINTYNSLIGCENLSEIDRKAFTYRLSQLLRSPVPEEDKLEEFIKDAEEILSTDDT